MLSIKITYQLDSIILHENAQQAEGIVELLKGSNPIQGSLEVKFGDVITTIVLYDLHKLYMDLWDTLPRIIDLKSLIPLVDGVMAFSFGITSYLGEVYGGTDYGLFRFEFYEQDLGCYWYFLYHPNLDEIRLFSHYTKPQKYLVCSKKQLATELYKLYLGLMEDVRKDCHRAFLKKEIMEDYEEWKENMKKYKKAIELL